MRAGKLRDVVTIQQKSAVTDATYGGQTVTWSTFAAGVRCQILALSGREILRANAEYAMVRHRVKMRYLAGVNSAMRMVTADGAVHDIVSVVDVDNQHSELELMTQVAAS